MILTIPFYTPNNKLRNKELISVLKKNIKKSFVKKIILLIDDNTFENEKLISPKINIIRLNKRPTYADWLRETKKKINQSDYHVIANADIELKDDFEDLISHELIIEKTFLLISRYNLISNKKEKLERNAHDNQDVWCLKSKDLDKINKSHLSSLNIPLGIPRCDNKIAYEFWLRDWKLINPCLRIKTIHHQKSGIRNYKNDDTSILGNVAFVLPSHGVAKESKVSLNIVTLSNNAPISIQITNWLVRDIDAKNKNYFFPFLGALAGILGSLKTIQSGIVKLNFTLLKKIKRKFSKIIRNNDSPES